MRSISFRVGEDPMMHTLTRKELYDIVWSKPMTHLAKEFALSDVALHKICKKHDVPSPPLGWWAKKAAGQRVKQTPFPRLKKGISDKITIYSGELRAEPELILTARERARVFTSAITMDADPPANRIVERTIARLLRGKPHGISGIVSIEEPGLIKIGVAPASAERLRLVLNRLAAVAMTMKIKLVSTEKSAAFECEGELIYFNVTEFSQRHKYIPTEEDKAAEIKRHEENELKYGREVWQSYSRIMKSPFPEWYYKPTGKLNFEFGNLYLRDYRPRRAYRDAKTQRLENMGGEIAVGIATFAAAIKHDRGIRDAEAEREKERKRQREFALRAKFILERRRTALDGLLGEVEELDRLRRLVTSLDEQFKDSNADCQHAAEFLGFAKAQLTEREAELSMTALERRFAEKGLFGDDDGRDFQPPRY